jgi:hypothetical protein
MQDLQREILNQVATGAISAEEGATRLQELEGEQAQPRPAAAAAPVARDPSVTTVRLVSRFGDTEVIADPSVAAAVADGPHRARQDGETLVIEQSFLHDDTTFEFSRPRGLRAILGVDTGSRLTIRMNPALALSARVQAGSLRVNGVHGSITGEIQAGNCNLTDFRGPISLNVAAGSVNAIGRLDAGASAIRCNMGEVRLILDPASSVRIRARSNLGQVDIDGSGGTERTLGTGAGTLDCECTLGSIHIEVS